MVTFETSSNFTKYRNTLSVFSRNRVKESSSDLDVLIADCEKGKRKAQQQLYQQFYNQIFGTCLRYTKDRQEAKALVNAAFMKAFGALSKYNGQGAFGAWLSRIAVNECIDHFRKNTKHRKNLVDVPNLPDTRISDDLFSQLATKDILACIQKLNDTSRTVFSMHTIDGYKHHEIAKQLGISEGTSRWYLSNAKKELQVLLKNYLR